MRILITNDDGINAPGLKVMHDIATQIANDYGDKGEVWTVAPAFEQSGVGHCISYTRPMMIAKMGDRRFAAEGSPADCVLAGLHDVMQGTPPDLVLSGVNRGNNSAENTLYSGTIGAAMESALQGIPAIAMSQYFGVHNRDLADPFAASVAYGADVVRTILKANKTDENPYSLFYNVNFPPVSAAAVKGMRAAPQGRRTGVTFGVEPHHAPSGRKFLWIRGGDQTVPTAADADGAVNLDGYISITPMRADLTAHDAIAALNDAVKG